MDFEKGTFSVPQLAKLHGVSQAIIYRWIYKFPIFNETSFRVIEMKDNNKDNNKQMKELEARVKELERTVGRKQIMIDFLEKMMEITNDELDIDIKKNYGSPQSTGSGKTSKK